MECGDDPNALVSVWAPWEGRVAKITTKNVTKHPTVRNWIKQAISYRCTRLATAESKCLEAGITETAVPPPPPAAGAAREALQTEGLPDALDMDQDEQVVVHVHRGQHTEYQQQQQQSNQLDDHLQENLEPMEVDQQHNQVCMAEDIYTMPN